MRRPSTLFSVAGFVPALSVFSTKASPMPARAPGIDCRFDTKFGAFESRVASGSALEPLPCENGMARAPRGPGVGPDVDWDDYSRLGGKTEREWVHLAQVGDKAARKMCEFHGIAVPPLPPEELRRHVSALVCEAQLGDSAALRICADSDIRVGPLDQDERQALFAALDEDDDRA